jgi:hypothetical protein
MPKVKRIRIRVRGRVVRGNGKGRPRMYYRMGEIRAAVDCAKKYSRHAWHYRTLVLSRHGAEEGFFVGDRFPLKLFRESIEVLRLL